MLVALYGALFGLPFSGERPTALRAATYASDTTPPQLQSFSFSPSSIDTALGQQQVQVTLTLTDDLAGIDGLPAALQVDFTGPSGAQTQLVSGFDAITGFTRTSGDGLSGTWVGSVSFPQFSEAGTWVVDAVLLRDAIGNQSTLNTVALQASYSTNLVIASNQDVAPPQLQSFGFVPTTVDVSTGSLPVAVTLGVSDDLAGVDGLPAALQVTFKGPSGQQQQILSGFDPSTGFSQTSGDPQLGTWQGTVTVPQFSEAGTWVVESVLLRDAIGNEASLDTATLNATFSTALSVVSVPSDVSPPQLSSFSFVPAIVDTATASVPVTVTLGITDDVTGVDGVPATLQVDFQSPSGLQRQIVAGFDAGTGFTRTSGNAVAGTWQGTVTVPQFSEPGTWRVDAVSLGDALGNESSLDTAALVLAGFSTELVVGQASLLVDGSVADAAVGGTVVDEVFQERAEITFPPSVLSAPVDVAIDVFADAMDTPSPAGFGAAGTAFMNVDLTPEPTFPLPSPGLTVVLPLSNFTLPGTTLSLFRINPSTGMLEAALDTSDQPIVGSVDAPSGLSATFTGVSRLSTVVGLAANTAPTITSNGGAASAAVNAAENQTAVTDVQSTDDVDSEGAGLTYSKSGGADQALFTLNTTTGLLTFTVAPDFETAGDAGADNVYDIQVTVTDAGALTDVQDIAVTVTDVTGPGAFTDPAVNPGVTVVRAVHVAELRSRINAIRLALELPSFAFTDPVLTAGVTQSRAVHVTELRSALAAAYAVNGLSAPVYTDPGLGVGTAIRGLHVTELRQFVDALEE
jgi:hypothetical protein